jgi:hypothetical protein
VPGGVERGGKKISFGSRDFDCWCLGEFEGSWFLNPAKRVNKQSEKIIIKGERQRKRYNI